MLVLGMSDLRTFTARVTSVFDCLSETRNHSRRL